MGKVRKYFLYPAKDFVEGLSALRKVSFSACEAIDHHGVMVRSSRYSLGDLESEAVTGGALAMNVVMAVPDRVPRIEVSADGVSYCTARGLEFGWDRNHPEGLSPSKDYPRPVVFYICPPENGTIAFICRRYGWEEYQSEELESEE